MQDEELQRAVTAFQEFLATPLEAQLQRHQHTSPESAVLALFHKVAADVPAYKAFLTEQGISINSIQTFADFQKLPLITEKLGLKPPPCRGTFLRYMLQSYRRLKR